MEKFTRGSQWHKWDLHVHTPASIFHRYGSSEDVWEKYIQDLEQLPEEFKVIGVNDYFFIDGYERLKEEQKNGRLQNLLLLPVLEFRIEKFSGVEFAKTKRINFHVIFSPDISCELIKSQFLDTLQQSYQISTDQSPWQRAITRDSLADLGKKIKESIPENEIANYGNDLIEGFNNLNLDEKKILESLNKDCFKNKYLIAVGKTEWDSLKWSDGSIATKKSIINSANLIFTASENIDKFYSAKSKLKEQGVKDFLLDCSDAHSFSTDEMEKDRIGNCSTWLKCDISFEGLRQVLLEPEYRVFVGDKPPVLKASETTRTKKIDRVKINKIDGYDDTNGIWFNDIDIQLNMELVAIIGNKGNGKSAIADIIALCANYKGDIKDFSFLNPKKFNDGQGKISKNFIGEVVWRSGRCDQKLLSDLNSSADVELVKYLPQGYFERLTNEIDSIQEFREEIENVVFTHVKDEDKLGTTSFQDLLDFKKMTIDKEIRTEQERLQDINEKLIKKEKMLSPKYRESIEVQKSLKEAELNALIEPQVVQNPDDDPENKKRNEAINGQISSCLSELNSLESSQIKKDKILKSEIQKREILFQIKLKVESQQRSLEYFKNELAENLVEFKIDINSVFQYSISYDTIDSQISTLSLEIDKIKDEIENETTGLQKLIANKKLELSEIQVGLGEKEKKYQVYLESKKAYEFEKSKIMGSKDDADTVLYLKGILDYIDSALIEDLNLLKASRKETVKNIYRKKQSILNLYKRIKESIDSIIEANSTLLQGYKINIEASFNNSQSFQKEFFEHVLNNRVGTYYGKENADIQLSKILSPVDFNDFDSVYSALENINDSLNVDLRNGDSQPTDIETQVYDIQKFYDFLYSLDFIEINYELRQDDKDLQQLSPGEKGALLLIFYLLLDKNDIPLIIDQPEDNLDNHSVANILVPFIKKAKQRRQIILVTHNPNLAVVSDAEQVIYVEIDKINKNKFSSEAGAIENKKINDCIVKVLEGGLFAITKRSDTYFSIN